MRPTNYIMTMTVKIKAVLADFAPRHRWAIKNGYRDVLAMCLPLIASSSAGSAMMFTDRLFLSHYSLDAIAASLPAGVAKLTLGAFFIGILFYVSVFAAQYTGSQKAHRAAASLWQGIYLSLICGFLMLFLYFPAPAIFRFGGHPMEVQILEVSYFRVLTVASVFEFLYVTMSAFLSGLGRTRLVMWITLFGAAINIPLDYFLIFGLDIGGVQVIPRWGVLGAAVATAASWVIISIVFAIFIFNSSMEKSHGVRRNRAFEKPLFLNLLKFGAPGGIQFFMEIAAFTFFAFIAGRLGEMVLAVNNIVFSIESLSFFPMIGVGTAVSVMVGQAIGRGAPDEGAEATKSGMVISSIYLVFMMALFLLAPRFLLGLFLPPDTYTSSQQEQIYKLGETLLQFVVLYGLFDGLYLCCFGAIRGAGDVMFPMYAMAFGGIFVLTIPSLILFYLGWATIYTLWGIFVFYVVSLTAAGVVRYRGGRWRSMSIIERPVEAVFD